MTVLIVICLILLLIAESLGVYNSYTTFKENQNVYRRGIKNAEDKINQLERNLRDSNNVIKAIGSEQFDHAFAITANGIKALPKGWQDKLWGPL